SIDCGPDGGSESEGRGAGGLSSGDGCGPVEYCGVGCGPEAYEVYSESGRLVSSGSGIGGRCGPDGWSEAGRSSPAACPAGGCGGDAGPVPSGSDRSGVAGEPVSANCWVCAAAAEYGEPWAPESPWRAGWCW